MLTPRILLSAYAQGVFPMAESRDAAEVHWVDPRRRGIFPLEGFHISRSLSRRILRGGYGITLDQDFAGVLDGCADREETWINPDLRAAYIELHRLGHAHSIEVRDASGALIGGLYAVTLGAAFFGESMFSRRTDASKIALAFTLRHLRNCGFQLFDTQFLTPHLASLGAVEISRADYHRRLAQALDSRADIAARPLPTPQEVVQDSTQTS
jgi:leucyl/phenylalanyl-tRNA--protein transferase